jgi:hypothetical protein
MADDDDGHEVEDDNEQIQWVNSEHGVGKGAERMAQKTSRGAGHNAAKIFQRADGPPAPPS